MLRPCVSDAERLGVHLYRVSLLIVFAFDVDEWVFSVLFKHVFVVLIAAVFLDDLGILDKGFLNDLRVQSNFEYSLIVAWNLNPQFSNLVESTSLSLCYDAHFYAAVNVPSQKIRLREY